MELSEPIPGEFEIQQPSSELTKDGLFPVDLSDEPRKPSRLRLECPWSFPVSGWKLVVLVEMTVVLFFNFASFSILATFFPNVAIARGASRTEVGLIFGAYPAIAFPASLVYGTLIPLVGTEKILLAGIFTNGLTVILFGFVPLAASPRLFVGVCFLLRVLAAVGGSACETTVRAIVLTEFSDHVGFTMGLLSTSTQLGFTVGPFMGGLLYSLGGFMLPFAVIGGFLLALLFLVCYALPQTAAKPQSLEKGPMFESLKLPGVILMALSLVVNVTGLAFLDPTLAPHVFQISPGLPAAVVGVIFLLCGLCAATLSPAVGWFCDKKGHYEVVLTVGLVICGVSLILVGPSPVLDMFIPSAMWLVCVSVVLNGASSAFVIAPAISLMSTYVSQAGIPDDIATNGAVSGIVTAAMNLGSFSGAFGGGLLNDWLSFSVAASVVAICEFLQAIFIGIHYLLRTKCRANEDYQVVEEQELFHP